MKSYWTGNGKYQNLADKIQAMIPESGPVESSGESRKLEKCRKAFNHYHDLHNSGLRNPHPGFKSLFGITGRQAREAPEVVESAMDRIIQKAALEQGIG
jgi:hypothetical protein